MRKRIVRICLLLLILVMAIMPMKTVKATETILPIASDNLKVGLTSSSELVATNSGYMRVCYNGKNICVEYYDNNFNINSKKTIEMELSIWGGFFAGENAYYVVEGQNNKIEDNNAEVIRVIKYDTNWNRLGSAGITANSVGKIRIPFNHGCVEMAECNGKLYIVTGHEGYAGSIDDQGHQGFLMIEVDEASMTGEIVKRDLSHSFAQYIEYKDSNLYVLEQCEGMRCTSLTKLNENNLDETFIPVFKYGGKQTASAAIECYATVDGMALSSNNILCIGTSIDQSKYDSASSERLPHNIYLTVTPINNFSESSTKSIWLTNFTDKEKSFLGVKLTKVSDNCFMVSWQEFDEMNQNPDANDTLTRSVLHYIFIDENGEKISQEYTAPAPISDCNPIINESKIIYYASNDNMVDFYTIDSNNGNFNKRIYRVGGEHITWELNGDTLNLIGTGEMTINGETRHRKPISTTQGSFSYAYIDNTWYPTNIKAKKIVIGQGITNLPDNIFNYFEFITDVKIEQGLKSIGKKAFYRCEYLTNITIPSSVTSIGEDFLWTGAYSISNDAHIVRATINAPSNSYAINYAKQNGIKYKLTDASVSTTDTPKTIDISSTKISSIKDQTYTGKEIKPSVTIKNGNTTLINGKDYTVSYKNNKNPGKATVTIKGKGNYTGTVTKTFTITVRKVSGLKAKSQTTSSITLNWSKASGVSKYQLYKYNSSKKKWEKVTTTSKTSYTVKKIKAGTIYKFRVRAYKTISKKNYYGSYSSTLETATKTKTPKISKITSKSKKATLNWKKVSGASGYEVYMATSKKGKYKKVKTTSSKTVKYTKSSLKKKKTYYFKIRTYRKVNGKKVYSSYSSVKSIKIK